MSMMVQSGRFGAPAPTDPNFADVVLLHGFESTTEESSYAATVLYETAHNQADNAKFGTHSLQLDSTISYAYVANDARFQFGTGHWTIEGWAHGTTSNLDYMMGLWSGASDWSYIIFYNVGVLSLFLSTTGSNAIAVEAAWSAVVGQYYHIAADFDGTTYRLYVDGVIIASSAPGSPYSLHPSTSPFYMGCQPGQFQTWNGRLDEFRVTKGVARYAGAFTPPTAAFPRS